MSTTDSTVYLSLSPLDPRCRLFSNFIWARDQRGFPTLSQQHLWVRFPRPITVLGCRFSAIAELGPVRFETSPDEGETWQNLAVVTTQPATDETQRSESVIFERRWPSQTVDNLRVVVAEAPNPTLPLTDYLTRLELICAGETLPFDAPVLPAYQPLVEAHLCPWQPAAGNPCLNINDRLGNCHQPPETNRVVVTSHGGEIEMASPLLRLSFSPHFALMRHLGWDLTGHGREKLNLLSTGNTQGAFPVVLRGCERRASDVGGGRLELNGRTLAYRGVKVVPELEQTLTFTMREEGLRLELGWKCTQSFRTAEYAALRLPLDLYQTVMSVLALPNTAGPSGLVDLPLVLQAPNHGSLQVTVVENASDHPVLARVSPLRVQAELWLDLIVGAQPLANGLFEIPDGSGRVVLDLRLNKIYPFAGADIYTTWQRPPFYSFVDRERILGTLPNAWLSGLSFRPELAMFANNSVAEAAAPCAPFYADIAAYTPDLAPGLPATAILRCVADTQLLNEGKSLYSDYDHFPQAASAPLDLAWLTVASTGDWDWAEQRRVEIVHWSEILLSMEYQETGLVASKYSGRAGDPQDFMSCSWWDSIRSGHIESHVDAYCYRTALRSSELLARLGQIAMATRLRAMAARAYEHFMPTFYNPHTRRIAQWVDVDGVRYGFDSHPHISAGIMCGLVPQDLARELLLEYLQRLQTRGFASYQYGLPILLDPIPARLHNPWMGKGVEPDGTDAVGAYMNGSITHHHTYEILQALYQTGLRREANDLFVKLTPLARSGGLSAGLHSGMDWRNDDGAPAGYEGLLAEQYQFLLAAITGYMGWELTIDGLRLNPAVRAACSDRVQQARPNFARLAQ